MAAMKRYCEEVSVDMGLDGKITDAVMAEAQRRLDEDSQVDSPTNGGIPIPGGFDY